MMLKGISIHKRAAGQLNTSSRKIGNNERVRDRKVP
jgi:hypothetical protein